MKFISNKQLKLIISYTLIKLSLEIKKINLFFVTIIFLFRQSNKYHLYIYSIIYIYLITILAYY